MAIYSLDDLRAAAPPELQNLSDDALLRDYGSRLGKSFEETANYFGYKPRSTLGEVVRQLVGGAVVDLPKMVGQGLQYTGIAPEYGREMAQAAEARALGYEPDMRGRGLVGQAAVLGARGVAPMAPALAASMLPGGQFAAPVVAAGLFGTSSAQETYDKLVSQDVSEEDATAAARRVGFINGPLEGAATAVGLRAAKGLSPLLGIGEKTTAGVAKSLTDTSVAKPFLKGMATNMVVQPATEVAQDVGSAMVERAYGAKEENLGDIAKQSAMGGFGLTMLLGPLALGSHTRRSKQAQALNQMLYGEESNPEQQLAARQLIVDEARKQGVPASDADAWFQRQYREDAASMDMLKQHEDHTIEAGKESPLADISYALSDPDLGPKISDTDREELVKLVSYSQQGNLSQEQNDEITSQANNIIGRYLVAEYDQNQEQDLMRPSMLQRQPALFGGLTQVQSNVPQDLTAYAAPQGLGREMPRPVMPTQVEGVQGIEAVRPGVFQVAEPMQQVSTFVGPRTTQPVSLTGAASAVQPVTPVVAGAPLKAPKRGPKTPKAVQAKAQGQEPAAVSTTDLTDDEAELVELIQKANATPSKPGVLKASVEGKGVVRVPGKVSLATSALRRVRDALLSPTGKIVEGGAEKEQNIADSVRAFAKAYSDYEDAGGEVSRTPQLTRKKTADEISVEVPTPLGRMTSEQRTVETAKRSASSVGKLNKASAAMTQALTNLGTAVGGNAKDVEAVVALVKRMVQKNLHEAGGDQTFAKAFKTMDTMLSRGWNAAKQDVFRGGTDTMYVRQGKTDVSSEAKGGKPALTQLEVAAQGKAAFGKGDVYTGLSGVLTHLRAHGTPFERLMAKAIRESLYGGNNEPKLVFIDEGNSNYDPATHTVSLRRDASPAVALHEALHAALQMYVHQNPKAPEVMALKRSLKAVVEFDGKLTGKAKEVQDLLKALVADKKINDAVLELISYGNTLNEFRTAMQEMKRPSAPKTFFDDVSALWNSILTAVQRMMGVQRSVASDVIGSTFKLLREAELSTAPKVREGAVLEAAIESNKPVSDAKVAELVGESVPDMRRWSDNNLVNIIPWQYAFNAVGVNEKNMGKFAEKAKTFTARVLKNNPRLEIVAGLINSRLHGNRDVSNIQDEFQNTRASGPMLVDKIVNFIAGKDVKDLRAVFAYLDGDKKALDKLNDNGRMKGLANILDSMMKDYVTALSPAEQKFFESRKFSETLAFATETEQVASLQFGLNKVNEILGKTTIPEVNLQDDWLATNEKGDPKLEGDYFRVFKVVDTVRPGVEEHAGFMSVEKFNQLNEKDPLGHRVDSTRKWILDSHKPDTKYNFVTNTTAQAVLENKTYDELVNAFRNLTTALANNFASKNFIDQLSKVGKGDSMHAQVVFDSIDEANAYINKDLAAGETPVTINPKLVLKVSSAMADSHKTKDMYRVSGTWVQMPESDTFGALSGKLLPGQVWNSLVDMTSRQPLVDLAAYNKMLHLYKKSKTSWNLPTQVSNAASNVVTAMVHDISFKTMGSAADILRKYEYAPRSLTQQDRVLVEAFIKSGALMGDFTNSELKAAIYRAHEDNLMKGTGNDTSLLKRVLGQLGIQKQISDDIERLAGKGADRLERLDQLTSQAYAFGDNVFRFAAFLKTVGDAQIREGVSKPTDQMLKDGGKFALKAFGDYNIDSKAVKVMRQSFIPFISWAYAMAPVIGRIALYQPWKLANVITAMYIMDAFMSAAAGDDDEELRKRGPESLRARLFGFGPYMQMRVPFLGDSENPVYVKAGDYFPFASTVKGTPNGFMGLSWFPAGISPSGPLVSAIVGTVGGVDPYTGKKITDVTDTDFEKLTKFGKFGVDLFLPPNVGTRNWGKIKDIMDEKQSISGNMPSGYVFARMAGLGLTDFNMADADMQKDSEIKRIERDFKSAINKAKRDEYRMGYPDYDALDERLDDLRTRMEEKIAKSRGEEE